MVSANGGLPAHRYTPQVTPRWPRGSEPASMGPSPATVCPIMWVNQAQARDDGYCTHPVLRISGAEDEILRVPRPGHAEKLPKGIMVPGIYIPHKRTSERK